MAKRGMTALLVATAGVCCAFMLYAPARSQNRNAYAIAQQQVRINLAPFLSGLSSPVYITSARDGTGRLFVVEQPGRVLVLQPGSTTPSVFLDIRSRVLAGGERGLLGLAFHPQFRNNNRFFVNYTRSPDGATVIAEYRALESNPNLADGAETVLLTVGQPFANHNGGMIEFGPDGFLYIALGDGGSANDPGNRAQNLTVLLGKILRIDIDTPAGAQPYSSPPTNPFAGPGPERDEIFALGLRNPWRFSFDRLNGRLFVGDVGQNAREEVNIVVGGGNYGWRVFEGSLCTNLGPAPCNQGQFAGPIAEYSHAGGRCSITGGYVYRGSRATLPQGAYIFADFCTGEIFLLQGSFQSLLLDSNVNISSFGEDESGELFVVSLGGTIHRIVNPDAVPAEPLRLDSFVLKHRARDEILDPVTVKPNGKKWELTVTGRGFVAGAVVVVGGVQMNTREGSQPGEELIARLRRPTLSVPATLEVEVMNPNGERSNQLTLQVVP